MGFTLNNICWSYLETLKSTYSEVDIAMYLDTNRVLNSIDIDLTGLSAAITPKFNTSKILVKSVIYNSNANAVNFFRVLRGSTFIEQPSGTSSSGANWNAHAFAYYNADNWQDSTAIEILDSPATTSATTYKIQMAVTSNTGTINKFYNTSNYYGISTLTLYEVSA